MRHVAFLMFLCLLSMAGYSQKYSDALLSRLDFAIAEVPHYDQEKIQRINVLRSRLLKNPSVNIYNNFLGLYKEYNIFNYDSAYTYARRMQQLAFLQNNADLIAYARMLRPTAYPEYWLKDGIRDGKTGSETGKKTYLIL